MNDIIINYNDDNCLVEFDNWFVLLLVFKIVMEVKDSLKVIIIK